MKVHHRGTADSATIVAGPCFDELRTGQVFAHAPAVTLTTGHAAALHQAIVA